MTHYKISLPKLSTYVCFAIAVPFPPSPSHLGGTIILQCMCRKQNVLALIVCRPSSACTHFLFLVLPFVLGVRRDVHVYCIACTISVYGHRRSYSLVLFTGRSHLHVHRPRTKKARPNGLDNIPVTRSCYVTLYCFRGIHHYTSDVYKN